MTPQELCKELGGYQNINKLVVEVNGKPQYLATKQDGKFEYTLLGKRLADEFNAKQEVGLDAKPKRRRAKKKKVAAPAEDPVTTQGLQPPEVDS